jgi:hypothetical protein
MTKKRWGWILIPTVIVVVAVIGLVISSFQEEAGLIEVGESGRAAVAAAVEAQHVLSATTDPADYPEFSAALLVAVIAHKTMPVTNPAETRLDHQLSSILDSLAAAREAWQAEADGAWDPDIQGRSAYWSALHPSLTSLAGDALTASDVREAGSARAAELLEKAIDLAG